MTIRAHRTRAWAVTYDHATGRARRQTLRRFFARRRQHYTRRTQQEMRKEDER